MEWAVQGLTDQMNYLLLAAYNKGQVSTRVYSCNRSDSPKFLTTDKLDRVGPVDNRPSTRVYYLNQQSWYISYELPEYVVAYSLVNAKKNRIFGLKW